MGEQSDPQTPAKVWSLAVDGLMDYFLAHGCPCRFPRFRALCERDTAAVGAPGYTSTEQQSLVLAFDRAAPLVERRPLPGKPGYRAKCARCGAGIERLSVEHFRDMWIEYLRVRPAKTVVDVGEPLHAPVPHCLPFYHAGATNPSEEQMLALSYPFLPVNDWLAWIRELRGTPE
ncbi:MAG: hypothetical protein ABSC94_03460 [Polyangiaceae bacterium]|jgi:hypothetical protein